MVIFAVVKRFCCIFLLALMPLCAMAQYNSAWPAGTRLDEGLYAFRMSAMPDYYSPVGDYMQYSPGAALVLMKACGVQGRSTWGSMITSAAFASAITAGLVNGMKYTICRPRPDASANNAFPSGHTATAFMTATLVQKEFGWKYPWIGFGGYAIATSVGFSRIMNNKHWGTDVIGGALVGVAAGELGYWLSSLIFKEKGYSKWFTDGPDWRDTREASAFDRMPYEIGAYFSTAAAFSAGRSAAFSIAGINGSIPFSRHLGATVRLGLCGESLPVSTVSPSIAGSAPAASYSSSYESLAGIYAGWDFFSLVFIRPHLYAGTGFGKVYGDGTSRAGTIGCRFLYAAGTDLGLQLTDSYALKFTADWEHCVNAWYGLMLGGGACFCF